MVSGIKTLINGKEEKSGSGIYSEIKNNGKEENKRYIPSANSAY